jgi:hypothetical protein
LPIVFAIGQATGLCIYARNLSFARKPDLEV